MWFTCSPRRQDVLFKKFKLRNESSVGGKMYCLTNLNLKNESVSAFSLSCISLSLFITLKKVKCKLHVVHSYVGDTMLEIQCIVSVQTS